MNQGKKYFHRGENVYICACSCGRVCARAYVFAYVCVWPMHVWARMRVRFRVCACSSVRGCASACVRDYCIILLLWSAVAQWENAGLVIEREVSESPLIPFRSLGIFFLFTMPQFTQLYK